MLDISKIFGTLQAATPIPVNNTIQLLSYSDTAKKSSNESVELLQNVSIGDFRAVTVSAHSLDILQKLVKDHPDVLSIVPDVDLTFDLPKPTAIGSDYTKRSLTPVIECSCFKRPYNIQLKLKMYILEFLIFREAQIISMKPTTTQDKLAHRGICSAYPSVK